MNINVKRKACTIAWLVFYSCSTVAETYEPNIGLIVSDERLNTPSELTSRYVVQINDTALGIANRVGVPISELVRLNPGWEARVNGDFSKLYVGDVLYLPWISNETSNVQLELSGLSFATT